MSETMGSNIAPEPREESQLEELDAPVDMEPEPSAEHFVQDRPPSPVFVPQQLGIDQATQTEESSLFCFDVEVQPILDVLVGTTLEQSLMEVIEEDLVYQEILRSEESELVRSAELTEAQRMEERQRRLEDERERRAQQDGERVEDEQRVSRRVAARGFAHLYVGDVVSNVFGTLEDTGFFYDPLIREIENVALPWLLEGVGSTIAGMKGVEAEMDAILESAVAEQADRGRQAAEAYQRRLQEEEDRKAAAAAKEEEERRQAEEAAAAAEAPAAEEEGGAVEGGGEGGGE